MISSIDSVHLVKREERERERDSVYAVRVLTDATEPAGGSAPSDVIK